MAGRPPRRRSWHATPFGKAPVLEPGDGTVLVESNAILPRVAEGSPWLPPPGLPPTRVLECLFFEQHSHEPFIAVARNIRACQGSAAQNAERLAGRARSTPRSTACPPTTGAPMPARPSPAWRPSPTPVRRRRAASTLRAGPACRPGWRASPHVPAS